MCSNHLRSKSQPTWSTYFRFVLACQGGGTGLHDHAIIEGSWCWKDRVLVRGEWVVGHGFGQPVQWRVAEEVGEGEARAWGDGSYAILITCVLKAIRLDGNQTAREKHLSARRSVRGQNARLILSCDVPANCITLTRINTDTRPL